MVCVKALAMAVQTISWRARGATVSSGVEFGWARDRVGPARILPNKPTSHVLLLRPQQRFLLCFHVIDALASSAPSRNLATGTHKSAQRPHRDRRLSPPLLCRSTHQGPLSTLILKINDLV